MIFYMCLINLFQILTAVETKLHSSTLLGEEITKPPLFNDLTCGDTLRVFGIRISAVIEE